MIGQLQSPEINSAPRTPPVSCPPSQLHSPSLTRSPLLSDGGDKVSSRPRTPAQFISPLASPLRKAVTPLASPLKKALKLTKFDPQDAWLPITESRNGNGYYAAFHTLCSGIGVQALVLPVAFTVLGWTWGIICLTLAFIWQLYTLYLLIQLHESPQDGVRYSRYITLCVATFGEKLAKILALAPIMYLSTGTCIALIGIGASTCNIFFQILCGPATCTMKPLTMTEWNLVFTCVAVILSQLPNLNSIAGVSLIGAVTAVGYITLIWVVSVAKGSLHGVSYEPVRTGSNIHNVFTVLNALGIIAFAFRGHNLILEIQATMPSSEKHPSRVPMWRGVKFAYLLIAMCLFPLAIGGFWSYGNMIPQGGGMLTALYQFHGRDTSRFILGLTSLFVIINALSSFQIYGMPMFDDIESKYTMKKKQPCPKWLRATIRALCGFLCFFFAVALPFVSSFTGLIGGLSLPITLAYPCFIWVKVKKPRVYGATWWLNQGLGGLGMVLSGLVTIGSFYVVIANGVEFNFFKPH